MKYIYRSKFDHLFFGALLLVLFAGNNSFGQSTYQPYSYDFYQKLNPDLYSTKTREHTSLKTFFIDDSLLKPRYDSIMNYGADGGKHSAFYNKLFTRHLIEITHPNAAFYADILPDLTIGKELVDSKRTYLTSIGAQVGGSIGHNFYFNISGYQSSAVFPNYLTTYIKQVGIVPGQSYDRNYLQSSSQWSYITAVVSYTPVKYLNISLGKDKTFIGDGYRSMLLSDYSSPYLFFKLTGTLGNVRYMAMWTNMDDPATTSQYGIDRRKFGVFHYLDWTVNNRLSIGLFDNVIGYFKDDNGVNRPFDFNYINPIIFSQPINNSSNDPDKSLLGLNASFKISDGITTYGQFALNEFHASDFFSNNGSFTNKYGWQVGVKGTNLFTVKNLTFLVETNNARPYTYQARSAIENYSNNGEPLAHPWGANFREYVGLLNYAVGRFNFSGEGDFGKYGLDINGLNYGKNIFKVYTQPIAVYHNAIGQGLATNLTYFQGKVSFVINPKYNLRFELGGIYRQEKNSVFNDRTHMITFGLRSSFREMYTDLASFKSH
jgi:hypothetical protein